ncbi:BMC domain-containing protein [candidate division CSSED10-310 bacterium]|uniref:BMC domain-containing protein n=1 Tax=candidate division CSSED10-310 bacterium TaxID=2855610 RepID=A0ABV6Z5K4_UNCC1
MNLAIGMIELNSIAQGIQTCDAMLKATDVDLITVQSVCPGKFIILLSGDIADIKSSVSSGLEVAQGYLVDHLIIPNVDPNIFPAISATAEIRPIHALGIIETFSVSSIIVVADAAAKAADVDLIEIRMAQGIGGKSYVTLTGDVGAVKEAVLAGVDSIHDKGVLVNQVVIPYPHENLAKNLI